MLDRLKGLLRPREEEAEDGPDELHLAAAVLLVEAATMDGEIDEVETATIKAVLERHFSLDGDDAERLISLAEEAQDDATHLQRYTQTVKDELSENGRLELIELLWEVVYADGHLHIYEANLLRRIGGLLYVSDRDRGEARKRVIERLGVET